MAKKEVIPVSDFDHGFHKHRRKAGALLVQMNASWRLQRMGYHHVWKTRA